MPKGPIGLRAAPTLLLILLAAGPLSAQPLLHHVDTFEGVPFTRASRLLLTDGDELLYAADALSGLSAFRRRAGGGYRFLASYLSKTPAATPPSTADR